MWGQINGADGKSRIEGAAGVQLARDVPVFDKADNDRIRLRIAFVHLRQFEECRAVRPRIARSLQRGRHGLFVDRV